MFTFKKGEIRKPRAAPVSRNASKIFVERISTLSPHSSHSSHSPPQLPQLGNAKANQMLKFLKLSKLHFQSSSAGMDRKICSSKPVTRATLRT